MDTGYTLKIESLDCLPLDSVCRYESSNETDHEDGPRKVCDTECLKPFHY